MLNMLLSVQSFWGDHGITWMDNFLPMCILAVITAFIIYNIVLMVARAFAIKELERFAMSEMLQSAATAFIAIFLVTMVYSVMSFTETLIHGEIQCGEENIHIVGRSDQSVLDAALDGIRCKIQEKAMQVAAIQSRVIWDSVGDFYCRDLSLSTFGLTFWRGDWDLGSANCFADSERARITNSLSTVLLIALNAQSYLIQYIKYNMLNVFLPIGLLLRSFKFTRGAGAFFMALAIGLYFVFPVLYVLLDPGFIAAELPPPPAANLESKYCYPTMSVALSVMSFAETGQSSGASNLDTGALSDALAAQYVALLLHPLISFFLTLVIIRYVMTVLGGDTYALTRMVMKLI